MNCATSLYTPLWSARDIQDGSMGGRAKDHLEFQIQLRGTICTIIHCLYLLYAIHCTQTYWYIDIFSIHTIQAKVHHSIQKLSFQDMQKQRIPPKFEAHLPDSSKKLIQRRSLINSHRGYHHSHQSPLHTQCIGPVRRRRRRGCRTCCATSG